MSPKKNYANVQKGENGHQSQIKYPSLPCYEGQENFDNLGKIMSNLKSTFMNKQTSNEYNQVHDGIKKQQKVRGQKREQKEQQGRSQTDSEQKFYSVIGQFSDGQKKQEGQAQNYSHGLEMNYSDQQLICLRIGTDVFIKSNITKLEQVESIIKQYNYEKKLRVKERKIVLSYLKTIIQSIQCPSEVSVEFDEHLMGLGASLITLFNKQTCSEMKNICVKYYNSDYFQKQDINTVLANVGQIIDCVRVCLRNKAITKALAKEEQQRQESQEDSDDIREQGSEQDQQEANSQDEKQSQQSSEGVICYQQKNQTNDAQNQSSSEEISVEQDAEIHKKTLDQTLLYLAEQVHVESDTEVIEGQEDADTFVLDNVSQSERSDESEEQEKQQKHKKYQNKVLQKEQQSQEEQKSEEEEVVEKQEQESEESEQGEEGEESESDGGQQQQFSEDEIREISVGYHIAKILPPHIIKSLQNTVINYYPSNYFHVGPRYQLMEIMSQIIAVVSNPSKILLVSSQIKELGHPQKLQNFGKSIMKIVSQTQIQGLKSIICQYNSSNYFHVGPRRLLLDIISNIIKLKEQGQI